MSAAPATATRHFRPTPAPAPAPALAPYVQRDAAPIEAGAPDTTACACGGGCPRCHGELAPVPQPKLRIGGPDHRFEREADRVAEQVTPIPDPQRQDADTETSQARPGKSPKPVQVKRAGPSAVEQTRVPAGVTDLALGPGQRLEPATRSLMEGRFRHDFGGVRVHTGGAAARRARSIAARAYTVGSDIAFGEGMYRPESARGQRLLAHELAHVVQQDRGDAPRIEIGTHADPDERQAERAVDTLGWGGLHHRYDAVASDVAWPAGMRPAVSLPELSPAGARIQRVQLTYDDGPDSAQNTRAVLNALNAAGARATFYLVGKRVVQGDNWRVVFDIAAGGHWLGNHAYDWNDATDNHIFLHGTAEERARKILNTEWAIRDALIRGRDDAKKRGSWVTIPQANRDYIEDVIASGTGRFRTPGFKSHWWTSEGVTTSAAIASVNRVLAATGLRPLAITEVSSSGLTREGVTVDPEDWRSGRTQAEVEAGVKGELSSNADTILLHSRIKATADATPAILAEIQAKKWTFDPTIRGTRGAQMPKAGFAGLSTISNPPTSAEIAQARQFFRRGIPSLGGYIAGSVALGILQMAQQASSAEVDAFIKEIHDTKVDTPDGRIPLANWMNANPDWRLFAGFFENWVLTKPFPRVKGVTY